MDDQPPGPLSVPQRERDPADRVSPARPGPPQTAPPPEARSRWRGTLLLILVLLVVAGLVAWVVLRAGHQPAVTGRFQSTGPTPVGTAKVDKGDMPVALSALGTVTPLAMVTVKTQINGQLIEVAI